MKKIVMMFIMLFVFTSVVFAGGIDVPKLERRVMDTANIFDKSGVDKLTVALKEIEKQGIQMAILTVPSLNGESIEDFSRRVVREWKLGEKGKDNGLLITISKGDRKWRVETGRGIQGALTDGVTKSIMTTKFVPQAKAGNFVNGLLLATKEMSDRYVSSLVPVKTIVTTTKNDDNGVPLGFKIFMGSIFILVIGGAIAIWKHEKNMEEERKRQEEIFEKYRKTRKEMGYISVPRTKTSSPIIAPVPVPIYISDPEPVRHSEPSRSRYDKDDDDDSSSRSSYSSSSSSSDSGSSSSDSGFFGGGGSFDGGGSSGDF